MTKKKGFTLIELVVVMAIIAVLALMIVGAIIVARNMQMETKHRNNGKALQVGMEAWYASHNGQYPSTSDIAEGATFATAAAKLGVTLDATAECNDTGDKPGGGTVTNVSLTTFSITPYNAACSSPLNDIYKQP